METTIGNPQCDNCGQSNFAQNQAQMTVCTACGVVAVEQSFEYHATIANPDRNVYETSYDLQRATTLRYIRPRETKQYYKFRRLSRLDQQMVSTDTNLMRGSREIRRISSMLSLPRPVLHTALQLYQKGLKTRIFRGKIIDSTAASCIYIAIRLRRLPYTLKEIAALSRLKEKILYSDYKHIKQHMKLKPPLSEPKDYVFRIISQMKIRNKGVIERQTYELLTEVKQSKIHQGKDPAGVAAAAIYAILKRLELDVSQAQIADLGGISEFTLKNRYKDFTRNTQVSNKITELCG